jgi:hypothetical protein
MRRGLTKLVVTALVLLLVAPASGGMADSADATEASLCRPDICAKMQGNQPADQGRSLCGPDLCVKMQGMQPAPE